MTDPKQPDELYLKWMEEHYASSRKREAYSVERLDLLTISICGAGLYICLETLRFLLTGTATGAPAWPVKVAGVLFTAAMAVNFLGQHAGARTNRAAAEWARHEMLRERNGKAGPELDRYQRESQCYGLLTRWANRTGTALMLCGVAALLITYLTFL